MFNGRTDLFLLPQPIPFKGVGLKPHSISLALLIALQNIVKYLEWMSLQSGLLLNAAWSVTRAGFQEEHYA